MAKPRQATKNERAACLAVGGAGKEGVGCGHMKASQAGWLLRKSRVREGRGRKEVRRETRGYVGKGQAGEEHVVGQSTAWSDAFGKRIVCFLLVRAVQCRCMCCSRRHGRRR